LAQSVRRIDQIARLIVIYPGDFLSFDFIVDRVHGTGWWPRRDLRRNGRAAQALAAVDVRSIGSRPIPTGRKQGKSDRRSNSLDALTGLRFIAASCIVIAHVTAAGYAPFGGRLDLAPAGMPLFFTLSGFIIHYVYSSDFAHSWLGTAHDFAVARFSRLYPLFAFLLLYHLLFSSLGKVLSDSPWILLSYATMTASWWYWHIDGITLIELPYGLSWSVSTEVFFYAVYALVLHRISALRNLVGSVAVLVAFCVLAYVVVFLIVDSRDGWTPLAEATLSNFIPANTGEQFPNSFLRWLIYVSPYLQILAFIAGALTCQVYLLMSRNAVTIGRVWREALGWAGVAWVGAGLIYNATAPDMVSIASPETARYLVALNFMNMNFLLAPGCCAVILALASGGCTLQAALAAPAIVGLGEISYSIYLAHPFISRVAYVTRENEHPLLSYAVAIAFVLIISEALYRRIEIPSKLFLRRLLGADAPRTAASETEAAIISEEFRNERRLPHSEFPADSSI
jgi:peptidoglycan/LPS O-acetylase OafA/YrhL